MTAQRGCPHGHPASEYRRDGRGRKYCAACNREKVRRFDAMKNPHRRPARWKTPILDRICEAILPDPESGCWVWQQYRSSAGYGKAAFGGRQWLAHRLSYTVFTGPIPDGLVLDHLCRNRACVNPDHLEPVTQAENNRRVAKTHCVNGHPYEGNRKGGKCAVCLRERDRARYRRKREAELLHAAALDIEQEIDSQVKDTRDRQIRGLG